MKRNNSDWVLGNYQVTGYYRVNYDQGNWDKLLDVLNSSHEVKHSRCSKTLFYK